MNQLPPDPWNDNIKTSDILIAPTTPVDDRGAGALLDAGVFFGFAEEVEEPAPKANGHGNGADPEAAPRTNGATPLVPNKADMSSHLYELFPPPFVLPYPDGWIEIAFASPASDKMTFRQFSAHDLDKVIAFAEAKNRTGHNIYVGAALRHGKTPAKSRGRASRVNIVMASCAWADFDKEGNDAQVNATLKEENLVPAMAIATGRTPHPRGHVYLRLAGGVTADEVEKANIALKTLFDSDAVQDPARLMRLAGTVSYPKPNKVARGYVTELVTLHLAKDAPSYTVEQLMAIAGTTASPSPGPDAAKPGRTDAEVMALLDASRGDGEWHNPMLLAIASMIGRGFPNNIIRMMCRPYCRDGYGDRDLDDLIDDARVKWGVPNEEQKEPAVVSGNDCARLNKIYAVLPIGGKTRVVKFGELPEFPGRETIMMTQTLGDFAALNDKYRHVYLDKKGEMQSCGLGSYWINNPKRRQYDGGMAFMPYHDGDVGNRLNLWRGFGVKAIKGECWKFLDFMGEIICSGNQEHYNYLIKREATILQKRIRTEVALGLRTKEEGCGKGFYERVMRRLTGHAMQLANPKHIVGAFNPHLEPLLRLTADEALFVGNHEHRNALFNLITEDEMTIEPKNCGVYTAISYLNTTILSNSDHFLPVSDTARRFFIPVVSAARMQDFTYFAGLQGELDNGGYEALLFYLLNEVNLTDFNVRQVPQTEGLRQQRDHSLPPLDAWWCELLETGTLWGADPAEPHRAVSNRYQRLIKVELPSAYSGTSTQIRSVTQLGIYDQARQIEPRLRNFTSDHRFGHFLTEMGCTNEQKVLRRNGWKFPDLESCRTKWEERYPNWKWRNPEIIEWKADGADDVIEDGEADDE